MDEIKWMFIFCTVFFGALLGGVFYGDHLRHIEHMECMKQKGSFIEKTCVFRETQPK